jgi:CRP/FNR family transcriptional regulator, cyclic AMP receptor protein
MRCMTTIMKLNHPFLAEMDDQHREIFLHGATEREFAAGEIIFRQGDPANTLYLIQSGEVVIEVISAGCGCGAKAIQTLGGGEVLGWSWLFPPFAWNFQARATKPTRVVCCDGGHLLVQAEEHPAFGYDLMRRITQILIHRLQATRNQLVESGSLTGGAAAVCAR